MDYCRGNNEKALKLWKKALDKNPNYYRAYNNMITYYRQEGDYEAAYALMQKMQELNKSNIARLVSMGELHAESNEEVKAEHCFKSALERDRYCGRALNGLAEIRFWQGRLDDSRELLLKSKIAYRVAAKLNRVGIDLVKKGKYKDALEHYCKAQYVLPQQEKGPLLFYNIGLCYSRWGKFDQAKEFLKIALVKEPKYIKAQRLLAHIESKT